MRDDLKESQPLICNSTRQRGSPRVAGNQSKPQFFNSTLPTSLLPNFQFAFCNFQFAIQSAAGHQNTSSTLLQPQIKNLLNSEFRIPHFLRASLRHKNSCRWHARPLRPPTAPAETNPPSTPHLA